MGDMHGHGDCLAGRSLRHQINVEEVRSRESNDALQSPVETSTLGEEGKGAEFTSCSDRATSPCLRSLPISKDNKTFVSTLAGCLTHQLPSPDKNTDRVRPRLSEDTGTSTKHLATPPDPHAFSKYLDEDGDIIFPDSRELIAMSKDQWEIFKAVLKAKDEEQARSQDGGQEKKEAN